ncbi:MAG TPA: hypothetical protein VI522_04615, partial [Gammaproteobacteria bacterium]|nr:hypothetical protein [Gammaproteobacteria bacterium]
KGQKQIVLASLQTSGNNNNSENSAAVGAGATLLRDMNNKINVAGTGGHAAANQVLEIQSTNLQFNN